MSCNKHATPEVIIHPASVAINEGSEAKVFLNSDEQQNKLQLTCTVLPNNCTNKSVVWESTNPDVAYVDNNGLITFKKIGKTEIKVTTCDNFLFDKFNLEVAQIFDWDNFVNNSDKDSESNWDVLGEALNNGLDQEDIIKSIEKSTSTTFDWHNEYEAKVLLNNVIHKVRLIGINHDENAEQASKRKVTMTWEFKDLVSDSNGNQLKVYWNNFEVEKKNNNYFASPINEILNSEQDKLINVHWYNSNNEILSSMNKSLYCSLSTSLQNNIIQVKKNVNIWNGSEWSHEGYTPVRVFLPTMSNYYASEKLPNGLKYNGEGNGQYDFYKVRQASQTKCEFLQRHSISSENCENYWFASPVTGTDPKHLNVSNAWGVTSVGSQYAFTCDNDLNAIAPIFCL